MKYKKTMWITLTIIAVLLLAGIAVLSHPSFGRLPRGERKERILRSPNFRDGTFQNLHPTQQMTSDKGMLGNMRDFLFAKHPGKTPDHPIPAEKPDLRHLDRSQDLYVWFGHSSYLLQIDGVRYLVDPVFTRRFPASFMLTPFPGTDIFTPEDMPDIDYLIISHDHWDHLDYPTVRALRPRVGHVICGLGVGAHFERWGYTKDQLIELDWNETAPLTDSAKVYCLPTRHFSGRSFFPNRSLWASYMLETPTRHIYIGGDGGYDDHFQAIARQFPTIDYAILENGQYNEDWRYIHMLPADLERAVRDLSPRHLITVHHSKYALAYHPWDEPLRHVQAMAAAQDTLPILIPTIGQIVPLNDRNT